MAIFALTSLLLLPVPPATEPEVASTPAAAQSSAELNAMPAGTGVGKSTGYILRCWQYGRLLFEEEVVDAPEGANRIRLRLHDAERSTVTLFELGGNLCSVRRGPGAASRN
jgi:hypothetical protein